MSTQYVVTLKKDSGRTIDLLSILLCLFAAGNFIYAQVRSGQLNSFLLLVGGIVAAGLLMGRYRYWLLVSALGWLAMPWLQWLSILYALLAFLEYMTRLPLTIDFFPDRVIINTLIPRAYKWSVFSNIIMKDGLLTLDFVNNRLFQKEVSETQMSEAAFNEYCRIQLKNP